MPSLSKRSYGPIVQKRARSLLQVILEVVVDGRELERGVNLGSNWSEDEDQRPRLTIDTTLQSLTRLLEPGLTANTKSFDSKKKLAGEALKDLENFVGILSDHRAKKQGSDRWNFSLRLWGKDIERNISEFDKLWESKRSPNSQPEPAPPKSGLKPGAPLPQLRLPDNFVARPDALAAVKEKLLRESGRTLVVSAIAGLGGLGKSVLATALVLDPEVQGRFEDGILWITLGQNPDLQSCLGDWIRALDKSRDSFSATTLESAKGYLHNLLTERRMLLVVDDVWNAAHSEWFRVGGPGCRVLVTTREAQVEGADYYALDLMSESEAVELVRRKLGSQWDEGQAGDVRRFARVVGYLPLALDLSVNLVRDKMGWGELQAEFEDERRAVVLDLFDSTESFELMSEKDREKDERKSSLKACFNLSLKRLNPEQRRRFSWLGVLPEDARIDARMVATLWNLSEVMAKKGLIELFRRSFLTGAGTSIEGFEMYRVHDLMHDTARGLIEAGELGGEGLAGAHGAFVDRYREFAYDKYLCGLRSDGYIHRHLTWHLVMAGREDRLHELLGASDGLGRNAWFEACEEIGGPAVFVQDVARGWALAEALYERDRARAIWLQGRYALITATLNTLLDNLPAGVMTAFVKGGFWSVERAWAYVEQMQDEWKIAEAIEALATYLTKPLFQVAVEKARSIPLVYGPASVLRRLAQIDNADFTQLLDAARSIQGESSRASVLSSLAQIDNAYFTEALEAARSIQDESSRASMLSSLVQIDNAYFTEALEAARSVQDESSRASVLSSLAQIDNAYFTEALETALSIQDEDRRADVLSRLAQIDKAYFAEALEAAQSVQNEYKRTFVLSRLTQIDNTDFTQLLEAARSIQNEDRRASALSHLAQIDNADFTQLLDAARSIQGESSRASVLSSLAQIDNAYFTEALEAARSIKNEYGRASVLSSLAQIDKAYFAEALEAARSIQYKNNRANALISLAQIDNAYSTEALEAVQSIQDHCFRASAWSSLAQIDNADFTQLLEAARSIEDEYGRAYFLSSLAQIDNAYFTEALEAARSIQDEAYRASVLSSLAQIDKDYFPQLLDAARSIQDRSRRESVLSSLAHNTPSDFLPKVYPKLTEITHLPTRATAVSGYLTRLPLTTLSHEDWKLHLHPLVHRKRGSLMINLAKLYPAIIHLGGQPAIRGIVDEMQRVCQQWP
jgi:glycerol-3-phosphate cytidylyltransferase-like family protein